MRELATNDQRTGTIYPAPTTANSSDIQRPSLSFAVLRWPGYDISYPNDQRRPTSDQGQATCNLRLATCDLRLATNGQAEWSRNEPCSTRDDTGRGHQFHAGQIRLNVIPDP